MGAGCKSSHDNDDDNSDDHNDNNNDNNQREVSVKLAKSPISVKSKQVRVSGLEGRGARVKIRRPGPDIGRLLTIIGPINTVGDITSHRSSDAQEISLFSGFIEIVSIALLKNDNNCR